MGPHVQAFASDTKQAIQMLQAGLHTLRQELDQERRERRELVRWVTTLDEAMERQRTRWERVRAYILGR